MSRSTRTLTTAAAGLGALALLAAPAAAHVTVQGPGATQGGYSTLTFKVPTEQATPTVKLQVVFPEDSPIASVSTKPHAGWTAVTTKGKPAVPLASHDEPVTEVVTSITWTAQAGGGITPGEFDEFDISVGPLPAKDALVFKALQTYADGSVVRWIEPTAADGTRPEHPAPTVTLAAAAQHGTAATGQPVASAGGTTLTAGTSDEQGQGLALGALVLGGLALLVAVGALFRRSAAASQA